MEGFKNDYNKMKIKYLTPSILLLALLCSCKQADIGTYSVSDSLVHFKSQESVFSLIGNTDENPVFTIDVTLVGPACDYDREISVEAFDNGSTNATEGVDFRIENAVVPAGELSGQIKVRVKPIEEGTYAKYTTGLKIVPNNYFPYSFENYDRTSLVWSNEYVRPTYLVYYSWWYFFCKGYSQNLHKVIVEILGEEAEVSSFATSARNDPDVSFKANTWWYNASRTLYSAVKEHDKANPDSPYMHSDDYEVYAVPSTPVGEGKKPDTVPTILSTLIVI